MSEPQKPSPPPQQGLPIVVKVCMGIGTAIGCIYAFAESSSALKGVPGGGGAGGVAGSGVNALAFGFLGAIVGGIVGFIISKFTKS